MDGTRRYLGALLALLIGGAARAQPAAPPARHFTFTVFSPELIEHLVYVPHPNAAPLPLVFYPTARSCSYRYAGPETVQLFDSGTGAAAAKVSVPSEIHTALFVLAAIGSPASATPRYRVQVVDDGVTHHPPGTLLILNLSGLQLAGTINQRHVTLAGGMNAPIRVGASAAVNLRTPFKGRSYQAYAETIPLSDSGRALLLLLPPYRQGSLEVQSRVLLDAPVVESREPRR